MIAPLAIAVAAVHLLGCAAIVAAVRVQDALAEAGRARADSRGWRALAEVERGHRVRVERAVAMAVARDAMTRPPLDLGRETAVQVSARLEPSGRVPVWVNQAKLTVTVEFASCVMGADPTVLPRETVDLAVDYILQRPEVRDGLYDAIVDSKMEYTRLRGRLRASNAQEYQPTS